MDCAGLSASWGLGGGFMELSPGKDLEHPSDVFVVSGSLSVDDG